ncbi:MAG: aminotransferase class III-fold pyridoxal phosphate-dependent enzyme [Deltaproteobacteria bacterium]|nr:aminotransferase class III-fold pyridoxal phosphate-dependent enzyme [Deltaproteobacteria bacterium]
MDETSEVELKRPRKIVAIIQARMRSSRLPGKVLADIVGQPMLWHVINRAKRVSSVDQVVVATSVSPEDDAIAKFCLRKQTEIFRGSEDDVLDRVYHAAKSKAADVVVRLTADCPLIDSQVIERVVSAYLHNGCDYMTNTLRYTFPDGLDTEVFSWPALELAWRDARSSTDREHVTSFFRTSGRFKIGNVENEVDLSARHLRWTVDEPCDLELARAIYSRLGGCGAYFGLHKILKLLDTEPSLARLNRGVIRNHGYYTSLAREAQVPQRRRELKRSRELRQKAERLIPSCSQTFSKAPAQFVDGVAPVFLARGQGSRVWDVDGNEYIDFPMALGPIILGHGYPAVTEAVKRQMKYGTTFSLPHPLEIEVAELLTQFIPCAEMVRFGKNGSDATSGTVRLARAYTGRDLIACCGYHGWQDWYIGTTTRNRGVPEAVQRLTCRFEYNSISGLEKIFAENPGKVAAVILEPVSIEEPRGGFLESVRDLTRREGALLIFDEVVTGFRIALGGAQEYYGVTPDLSCLGKAMGNGYPISAVVGPTELMELFDEIFFSFTFGGETLSLAAAKATIAELEDKNVVAHLWEQGQRLKDGYNVLAREYGMDRSTECVGLPPRTVIVFRDETGAEALEIKSLFEQECLRRGILFSGGHNLCYSHRAADIDYTLRVYRTAMEIVAEAVRGGLVAEKLEGKAARAVFRKA